MAPVRGMRRVKGEGVEEGPEIERVAEAAVGTVGDDPGSDSPGVHGSVLDDVRCRDTRSPRCGGLLRRRRSRIPRIEEEIEGGCDVEEAGLAEDGGEIAPEMGAGAGRIGVEGVVPRRPEGEGVDDGMESDSEGEIPGVRLSRGPNSVDSAEVAESLLR